MISVQCFFTLVSISMTATVAFTPLAKTGWGTLQRPTNLTPVRMFDKLFEEEGPLGKGITVGKIQVALFSKERGSDSIFGDLEHSANSDGDLPSMAHEVCLSLLRRSSDWTAAHSDSKWFKFDDAGKAESLFNDWANREAIKFEKEYIPSGESDEKGSATTVVVSLLIEIEGDSTKFQGAGFSLTGTKEVLTSIASDVLVAEGEVVNAVEVFWTPSKRDEVLTSTDLIADFPELITL